MHTTIIETTFLLALFGIYQYGLSLETSTSVGELCPQILYHVFEQYAPAGGRQSGNFTEHSKSIQLNVCVKDCCLLKTECNVAFIFNGNCYHVKCVNNELCLPKESPSSSGKIQMVLVNPVSDGTTESPSWADMLKNSADFLPLNPEKATVPIFWKPSHKLRYSDSVPIPYEEDLPSEKRFGNLFLDRNFGIDRFAPDDNDLPLGDSSYQTNTNFIVCTLDMKDTCRKNEECVAITPNARKGFCSCQEEYTRNKDGDCVRNDLDFGADSFIANVISNTNSDETISNSRGSNVADSNFANSDTNSGVAPPVDEKSDKSKKPIKQLAVSVVSKNVRLPEKEVSLAAYTVPDEQSSGDTYKYLWTLISQPNGAVNGTMSDQTKDKVKLSNLSEGLYTFKVTVSGNSSYGETLANVTVLPEKRINKIPQPIITPNEQKVKLPNSKAILDGSTSTDDDKIVNWHWELIQGPIGYQPKLPETSTLELTDLVLPGNYTFQLTVIDSDNAKNSTTASISVLKGNDYPPEANAGSDVIVYLPYNNVTLNGSLSTDDREIVAWEWTKDTSDQSKAVDMQNTRTPYLKLSNLEEGIYSFVLKVTDASNQSSTAKVHVFVKPPANLPPTANAGSNMTINLPQTWVQLNGSLSKDDISVTKYFWRQVSGPNTAIIANENSSIANATALTIGLYEFELNVIDDSKNNASDRVWVKVIQERNSPPIANAGGDQSVTLPVSAIYLNGSKSTDDLGIVNYTWSRDSTSLATGNIVGFSDHEPILVLTNLVPGRYVFQLTVTDDQGLTGMDTVSIIVRPDPLVLNLIELTLSMGITVLSQSELELLEQKVALLIGDVKLHRRDLRTEPKSGNAILVFYVEKILPDGKMQIVPGLDVEKILKDKFWRDASILGTTFTDVRTTICQNKCSEHGICNTITRACMCETFWMPSMFYFWGIEEANCDWSILYVVVGIFVGFLVLSGICWGITCLCRRTHKPRSRSKVQKYAPLGTQEDEIAQYTRGTSLSDSETDSDVLFESRSKQNGFLRSNGVKNGPKYSTTRLGRRIKT